MKLFLKSTRCDTPKCAFERREYPPGMHQWKKGKPSSYGIRLREKQKLKRFYGVLEAQFRRYYALATRAVGNTGEQLLSILERRLDNVLHRLGFASSRATASFARPFSAFSRTFTRNTPSTHSPMVESRAPGVTRTFR